MRIADNCIRFVIHSQGCIRPWGTFQFVHTSHRIAGFRIHKNTRQYITAVLAQLNCSMFQIRSYHTSTSPCTRFFPIMLQFITWFPTSLLEVEEMKYTLAIEQTNLISQNFYFSMIFLS